MSKETSILRQRWATAEGRGLVKKVLHAWQHGSSIMQIDGLSRYEGRIDLRGIALYDVSTDERSIANSTAHPSRPLTIRNVDVTQVDFSHSQLDRTVWLNCRFEDVYWSCCSLTNSAFFAARFRNCMFDKTNFKGAGMGGGSDSRNRFEDCVFGAANLKQSTHSIELYSDCVFDHCDIASVDFDAASFTRCSFIGGIIDVTFRNRSQSITVRPLIQRLFTHRSQELNKMEHVDFSRAILRGADFDGIDLSNCNLPEDECHLVIHQPFATFTNLYQTISDSWPEPDRSIAMKVIGAVFLGQIKSRPISPGKRSQPLDVVNLNDFKDWFGASGALGEAVYRLLQSLQEH